MKHSFLVLLSIFVLASCSGAPKELPAEEMAASSLISQSASEVVIDSPLPKASVSSPLTVTGKAKGTWFFEASLPISLVDDAGNLIAEAAGEALGDWMTTDFVDFKATLTFSTTATSGKLIIRKDNPSGLQENDASTEISVTF